MRQRITLSFLSPDSDPLGAGYNMIQARISIGSGGWWGRGLGEGTQTQLSFLRVRHTDFIFAVVGEELGFFGAIGVLVAYAWLILRCLAAVTSTTDVFGRLLATGVATMLLFEIFVNVGVNLGTRAGGRHPVALPVLRALGSCWPISWRSVWSRACASTDTGGATTSQPAAQAAIGRAIASRWITDDQPQRAQTVWRTQGRRPPAATSKRSHWKCRRPRPIWGRASIRSAWLSICATR